MLFAPLLILQTVCCKDRAEEKANSPFDAARTPIFTCCGKYKKYTSKVKAYGFFFYLCGITNYINNHGLAESDQK